MDQPALISEGEWQETRGEVVRLSGSTGRLERVVKALDGNVTLWRGELAASREEVRELRKELREMPGRVREDSSSDLRSQLDAYHAKERETEATKQLEELTKRENARRAWIFDLVKIILATGGGALLVKLLHL